MDSCAVTNVQYAIFIAATGYVTLAERPLDLALYPDTKPELAVFGALVFHMTNGPVDTRDPSNWWSYVPCWSHPKGPGSDIAGRESHPVVRSRSRRCKPTLLGPEMCRPSSSRPAIASVTGRLAARQPQMIDSAMSHIGFRCIQRPKTGENQYRELRG